MNNRFKKEQFEKRLKNFAFEVIKMTRKLSKNDENRILSNQIIRSATSIGANYAEAVYGQTRQEFIHCLSISRKESNETLYWLELILLANPNQSIYIQPLISEVKEILKIFISSTKTINLNKKNSILYFKYGI